MNAEREAIDPRIDALLREHSTQGPPAHVDAAILAAAHRAVRSTPPAAHRAVRSAPRRAGSPLAGGPLRWWMPLAAAAVIGVVVIGVVPLAPTAPQPSPAVVDDAPAPAQRNAPAKPARESVAKAPLEFAAPPSNTPVRPAPAAPIEATPAPKPDGARLSMQKQQKADSAATGSRASTAAQAPAADQGAAAANVTVPHPRAPSAAKVQRESPHSDARRDASDYWIARIRALRNVGNIAEARAELTRFRAAFDDADERLPADLRAWAASWR